MGGKSVEILRSTADEFQLTDFHLPFLLLSFDKLSHSLFIQT